MARFGKLGWVLGLFFGAVFGVLFAPRKGKELREKIKAERKKGRLGVAPLQDDMVALGHEIADIAKSIYVSEYVSGIVEKGREQVQKISDNLVSEVADFHKTRIKPLENCCNGKLDDVKKGLVKGKRAYKGAKKEIKTFKSNLKKSARIGKKALKEIDETMRKKQQ